MTQPDLFTRQPAFDGATFDPNWDADRLSNQMVRVRVAMSDGAWRTLGDLSAVADAPEASCSARLRDLRKARFGGYTVQRRHRGDRARGLFEYRLVR